MAKRWVVRQCDEGLVGHLARCLEISPITAQVLIHRGVHSAEAARMFLQPQLSQLSEPDLLPDLDAAVSRICRAVTSKERILVYGDYDADGVTATALLLQFFRQLGVRADYYIPHRVEEGYGLTLESVKAVARRGVDLMITVDCGVTAMKEIAAARAAGIDVVVTDHHEPGVELPPAVAVVNPKLTGARVGFRELSGVGVVFKLIWALAKALSPDSSGRVSETVRKFLLDAVALVALGTIADVVPLLGENRVLARYGLQALPRSSNLGVQALLEVSALAGKTLTEHNVAFGLAPRLNAAGRLSDARLGVELLTTDSAATALELARRLDRHNRERQKMQERTLESARQMIQDDPVLADSSALVLFSPEWHPGVIGVVASRLAEEYSRPVVLIAVDRGKGKGSARSVPGLHLYEAIDRCRDLLESCGGHAGAAGLRIDAERIPEFRERFVDVASEMMGQRGMQPTLEIDADVHLWMLSRRVVDELACLAPFGESNPAPVLAASHLKIAGEPRLLGSAGKHLSFVVRQGDTSFRAVAFSMGELYEALCDANGSCAVAFEPQVNRFNGSESIELRVHDVRLTD